MSRISVQTSLNGKIKSDPILPRHFLNNRVTYKQNFTPDLMQISVTTSNYCRTFLSRFKSSQYGRSIRRNVSIIVYSTFIASDRPDRSFRKEA